MDTSEHEPAQGLNVASRLLEARRRHAQRRAHLKNDAVPWLTLAAFFLRASCSCAQFDDPRAHRALVDQARIERTVLVESAAAGWALWERRPANVEHVFTIGGQRLGLSYVGTYACASTSAYADALTVA